MRDLSVADQEYFDHIAQDCAQRLGPGIELEDLALHDDGEVVLRLRYRLGAETWTSEGRGETVVAAHAALRDQLVLDRIGVGVRALTLPPSTKHDGA